MEDAQKHYDDWVAPTLTIAGAAIVTIGAIKVSEHFSEKRRKEALGIELANAAQQGQWGSVKELIMQGAHLNELSTGHGFNGSALHHAVISGNFPMCELLIKHGADICHQNDNGDTPLHIAIDRKTSREIQDLLLQYFKNVYKRHLLSNIKSIDLQDHDKNTPLHLAILREEWKTVALLLDQKANTQVKNRAGETPLDALVNHKRAEAAAQYPDLERYLETITPKPAPNSKCLVM